MRPHSLRPIRGTPTMSYDQRYIFGDRLYVPAPPYRVRTCEGLTGDSPRFWFELIETGQPIDPALLLEQAVEDRFLIEIPYHRLQIRGTAYDDLRFGCSECRAEFEIPCGEHDAPLTTNDVRFFEDWHQAEQEVSNS